MLSRTSQEAHLRCLRKILGITWMDKVSNQDVLSRANLPGVEALITKAQLRWSGHVMCMEDSRLPKKVFCSELAIGKRKQGGQRKRNKDCLYVLAISPFLDGNSLRKIVLPADRKRKMGLQLLR